VGGALLALQAARVAAENCAKVTNSIHGDQTLSAGAAHVKSDEVTQRIVMSTLPKLDRANEFAQTEITTLMAKTSGPVVDPAGRAFGSEIRAVLHKMDAKARRQAIATAVEKNDLVTLGAILGAPALLTNLSANELEHLRQTWRRKNCADGVARIERLEAVQKHLLRSGSLLQSYQRSCSDQRVVEMARKSQKAAKDAIEASGAA
jgi:hypothetical protein